MTFRLRSPAFADGDPIPERFTCDGADTAPPLTWSGTPAGTDGFALIVDDPDAPSGTFTHWLLYDIPGAATGLDGGPVGKSLPNGFGGDGYGGPCPPRGHGTHRYAFTLYAVDVGNLPVHGRGRGALEQALRRHTIATTQLVGRYSRRR